MYDAPSPEQLLAAVAHPAAAFWGDPAGAACTVRGSGFSLRDSCQSKCLALWSVRCPGAEPVRPAVCAGAKGCTPGSCPQGQACYAFEDPFDDIRYCVPVSVCAVPLDEAATRRWEADAAARAAALRERRKPRQGSVTRPVP